MLNRRLEFTKSSISGNLDRGCRSMRACSFYTKRQPGLVNDKIRAIYLHFEGTTGLRIASRNMSYKSEKGRGIGRTRSLNVDQVCDYSGPADLNETLSRSPNSGLC
jgi:hypothetical protein